jgi:hypothetical protein
MAIYPLLKPVVREAKEIIISRGDALSDLTFVHKGTVHAYGHWNAARQLRPPEWAGGHPILGSGSALRTTRRVIGPRTARVLAEEEELALRTAQAPSNARRRRRSRPARRYPRPVRRSRAAQRVGGYARLPSRFSTL